MRHIFPADVQRRTEAHHQEEQQQEIPKAETTRLYLVPLQPCVNDEDDDRDTQVDAALTGVSREFFPEGRSQLRKTKGRTIDERRQKICGKFPGFMHTDECLASRQIQELENNAKQYLDSEALSRYGNIKLTRPEKAFQIAVLITQLVQSGQFKDKISDDQLKDLLMKLQEPKKEFRFTRK